MPLQVEKWTRTLLIAQPDIRSLLERQILATGHRVFGDFRNKLLLTLPPKAASSGPLHLGRILYETEKWDFGLTLPELMQNLAIFGIIR